MKKIYIKYVIAMAIFIVTTYSARIYIESEMVKVIAAILTALVITSIFAPELARKYKAEKENSK